MRFEDYSINISPIPEDEGGGYLVTFPDLPGCIADGETIDEAVAEARDAFAAWTMAEQTDKGALPTPSSPRPRRRPPAIRWGGPRAR